MTIYYNTDDEPYNCFSNFSPHGFELDDLWWPTSEHYFQAQKFVGSHYAEKIRLAKTPLEAAQMGQERSLPLRKGWRQIKEEIMLKCVLHKFQVYDDLRSILLSTGHRLIVEDWPLAQELDTNLSRSVAFTVLPGIVCIGGVYLFHFGLVNAIMLYNISLGISVSNALWPLFKHERKKANALAQELQQSVLPSQHQINSSHHGEKELETVIETDWVALPSAS